MAVDQENCANFFLIIQSQDDLVINCIYLMEKKKKVLILFRNTFSPIKKRGTHSSRIEICLLQLSQKFILLFFQCAVCLICVWEKNIGLLLFMFDFEWINHIVMQVQIDIILSILFVRLKRFTFHFILCVCVYFECYLPNIENWILL